jgi:hypothetical protein
VVVIMTIPVRLISPAKFMSASARTVTFITLLFIACHPYRKLDCCCRRSQDSLIPIPRESVFFGAAILPEAGREGASGALVEKTRTGHLESVHASRFSALGVS